MTSQIRPYVRKKIEDSLQHNVLGLKMVTLFFCEHYITSKQVRLKFSKSITKIKYLLALVQSSVWESPVQSIGRVKPLLLSLMISLRNVGFNH